MPRSRWAFNENLSRAQQMGPRALSILWSLHRNEAPSTNVGHSPIVSKDVRTNPGDEVGNERNSRCARQSLQTKTLLLRMAASRSGRRRSKSSAQTTGRRKASALHWVLVQHAWRVRKRLEATEEAAVKAVRFKSTMESELEHGLARLQSLREQLRNHQSRIENTCSRQKKRFPDPAPVWRNWSMRNVQNFRRTSSNPATEEENRLLATVEDLRRERIALMSEVFRQTGVPRGRCPRKWKHSTTTPTQS